MQKLISAACQWTQVKNFVQIKHIYCSWNNGNFEPIVQHPGDTIAPRMRKNKFKQEWVNSTRHINCQRKWLLANYLAAN